MFQKEEKLTGYKVDYFGNVWKKDRRKSMKRYALCPNYIGSCNGYLAWFAPWVVTIEILETTVVFIATHQQRSDAPVTCVIKHDEQLFRQFWTGAEDSCQILYITNLIMIKMNVQCGLDNAQSLVN